MTVQMSLQRLIFILTIGLCLWTQDLLGNYADEALSVFPKTIDEMEETYSEATRKALAGIQEILAIPLEKRTFENTVSEFDRVAARFYIPWCAINTLEMVHPDHALRTTAAKIKIACNEFAIDYFETHRGIYQAFKDYADKDEKLNAERAYFLDQSLSAFRRIGMELDAQSFEKMKALAKQIASLGDQFCTNINQDGSSLVVAKEDLAGMDEEFIDSLQRENDLYVLACDYPTRSAVFEKCAVVNTRKAYYRAFSNRAFPQNHLLLNELISKRDELAKLLGYNNYAELDIEPEMAASMNRVANFLDGLFSKTAQRAIKEWRSIAEDLPESVTLTSDGKIKPWDEGYLSNYYKLKNFNLDSDEIAKYFPLEGTLTGMLSVFGQFLDLQLKIIPCQGCWDPSVILIEVCDSKSAQPLIGHLLLDLFPRVNKYSHACCNSIVLPMSYGDGQTYQPALAILITNFSKPTLSKPSLLKHQEVVTLFHEFGHGMHALLGRSEMPRKGAYNTTLDFIETPSQMFEEWIWDREILKRISSHYQTGESLSDELIDCLVASGEWREGRRTLQELRFAQTSLNCFMSDKDPVQMEKNIHEHFIPAVAYDPESNPLYSFSHLVGYGAKYYSYLWSKELAIKFIDYIRAHGDLLDPVIGKRYREKVIGRGGSCDPEMLVSNFLSEED